MTESERAAYRAGQEAMREAAARLQERWADAAAGFPKSWRATTLTFPDVEDVYRNQAAETRALPIEEPPHDR